MRSILSAVLCLLPFVLQTVSGCSCMWGTHTQAKFCSSGYALTGTVKSVRDDFMWKYFTIEVDRVYKEPNGSPIGSEVIIKTGGDNAMCGMVFKVNTKMFLNGHVSDDGQLSISSCDWVSGPERLTPQQLKGLEGEYAKNCDCKIQNRYQPMAQCKYGSSLYNNECLARHSYCGRDQESGQCTWVIDHNNKTCQKRGRRNLADLLTGITS